MVSELENYVYQKYEKYMYFEGLSFITFFSFLAVVMMVFVVAMLKLNLERTPKQNNKENSIQRCWADLFSRVLIENFHPT